MNIHEYQAKELLEKFGVATTRGKVPRLRMKPRKSHGKLGATNLVVKAQVHAGGRGKGTFQNGFKGGVHLVKSASEAREVAEKMLGQTLVTHQTGAAGRVVNKVLVAESADIAREIYFAILLDRATAAPLVVASTEGGVEIETVAATSPGEDYPRASRSAGRPATISNPEVGATTRLRSFTNQRRYQIIRWFVSHISSVAIVRWSKSIRWW